MDGYAVIQALSGKLSRILKMRLPLEGCTWREVGNPEK